MCTDKNILDTAIPALALLVGAALCAGFQPPINVSTSVKSSEWEIFDAIKQRVLASANRRWVGVGLILAAMVYQLVRDLPIYCFN